MSSTLLITFLTILLLIVLLALYGYLFISKWRGIILNRRKQAWLDAHISDIEAYLVSGVSSASILPRINHQYEVLENYLSDYLSVFKTDPELNPLKDENISAALTARYTKNLFHYKWSIRMNTLYFILLFKMDNMRDNVLELLRASYCQPEEEFLIFIILAEFRYDQLMELFSSSRRNIPTFLLHQMLGRLIHQENFEDYVDHFAKLPYEWKLSVLDVFRDQNLRSEKLQMLLEQLLLSEDRELRLRSLKTLGSICYVTSPDVIKSLWAELSGKKEWSTTQNTPEKIMLARLMGNIRYECFIPCLEELISDRVYAVRNESTRAIQKFKDGRQRLMIIATTHTDSFARNIANEWLERSVQFG